MNGNAFADDFLNAAADQPSGTPSGASNQLLDRFLNTGLGVAGLFTNRTPASQRTGTPGAPNWTMIAVIGGAIVVVLVLVTALRK